MLVFLGLVFHDPFFPLLPLEKKRKRNKSRIDSTFTTTVCSTAAPKDFPTTDDSSNDISALILKARQLPMKNRLQKPQKSLQLAFLNVIMLRDATFHLDT